MRPVGGRPVGGRARDPAPSRLVYRLQRLWLRRGVRLALRWGLPLALLVGAAGLWLSDPQRQEGLRLHIATLRDLIEDRPEFMVQRLEIRGASPELAEALRAALDADFPQSSFDLDLEELRAEVLALHAVAGAELRIQPGGTLLVEVVERVPAVLWRQGAQLVLLDATGHPVGLTPARGDWPDLPLIAGEGADQAVAEGVALALAAAPLGARLIGLERRGVRRWDMVLDRGQRILLPETGALPALETFLALDEARDILARDITHVDLRDPARRVLRLSQAAMTGFRQASGGVDRP